MGCNQQHSISYDLQAARDEVGAEQRNLFRCRLDQRQPHRTGFLADKSQSGLRHDRPTRLVHDPRNDGHQTPVDLAGLRDVTPGDTA